MAYMTVYWRDWLQLCGTVAAEDTQVVIHLEPDFWGYLQQSMKSATAFTRSRQCASRFRGMSLSR